MLFILLFDACMEVYPLDSDEAIERATWAVTVAGLARTEVYYGDPEGDHQRTGAYLYGASLRPPEEI